MSNIQALAPTLPTMALSHVELYVADLAVMERFYTEVLGFVVTDRGAGQAGMVFLSRNPSEHHQLVLNPQPNRQHHTNSPVDHLSFRVATLADLRQYHHSVVNAGIPLDTVSHGSAWSIYFRDPEANRFEIFTDTPWYVHQPCKFKVDFNQSDDQLIQFTLDTVAKLPGFMAIEQWQEGHGDNLA